MTVFSTCTNVWDQTPALSTLAWCPPTTPMLDTHNKVVHSAGSPTFLLLLVLIWDTALPL